MQVFTSSGTWTKPSGISLIKVTVVGGGGGGGGYDVTWGDYTTAGAGAGGTAIKMIDVSSITSETVTIGSGGSAGTGSNSGSSGGTSSFGSHCSASGGGGSDRSVAGTGGIGSSGDINIRGQHGYDNAVNPSNWFYGGHGGNTMFGSGGYHSVSVGYGAGGNGCRAKNTNGTGQQDGGDGIVIVEEYK